jgi:hypothetical protein
MGSHILDSLLASPNKHSITILTRASSSSTFPESVKVAKVDYDSDDSITSALKGIDFLVITLKSTAPADLHSRIVNAAAAAGVKYIMPNYFGYALPEEANPDSADPIMSTFARFVFDVRDAPGPHYVALVCGFWYEWSLGLSSWCYGFDIAERKVTMYDDGMKKINTSTWNLCADAVAKIVDGGLEKWADKAVHISSFLVSQRDMLDSLHRVLGTTDKDWEISYQPSQERLEEGMKEFQEGKREGFAKAMYVRAFLPDAGGRGDYETGRGLENEKLGLAKEDLDEATLRTVKMVDKGFSAKTFFASGKITRAE